MTQPPVSQSDIILILAETSWKDLGIKLLPNSIYDKDIKMFFFSEAYKEAVRIHFDSPLTERGSIPDDMALQQFTLDIQRRWKLFFISRNFNLEYDYENGPNGERSF